MVSLLRGIRRNRPWPETVTSPCPGGTLELRPLSLADEHPYLALRLANADWLRPWDATPPPRRTRHDDGAASPRNAGESFRRMTRDLTASAARGGHLPWLIWFTESAAESAARSPRRLVGQLTVGPVVLGSARSASLGYWIDQGHAGRGLMTLAVAMACDHLFFVRDLHRVEISVRPENAASLRVVEKLGLREEGLRPRYLHIAGDWRDHRVFAVTREEIGADATSGLLARLRRG